MCYKMDRSSAAELADVSAYVPDLEVEAKPPVEPLLDTPVIDGSGDTGTLRECTGDDRKLVEVPIDFRDDTLAVPAVVTDDVPGVGPEKTPEAQDLEESDSDRNQRNDDDDDDHDEDDDTNPPAGAGVVRPRGGGNGPRGAVATKEAAAGKPHTEKEARLIVIIAEAIHRAKVVGAELDDVLFEVGRHTHTLVEECGWTLKRIGKELDYAESSLSQHRNTYLSFPTAESRLGMNFSICQEARKVHSRLSKGIKQEVSPTQILAEIKDKKLSARGAAAHFNQKALKEAKKKALDRYETELAEDASLRGKVWNRDCLDVLREMADKSVKLIHADPPYAEFWKAEHQGYESGRESVNGLRVDCENNTAEAAVPLMIKMFQLARRVVRDDGCLIFWSAGMHADRPEIVLAAREAGWECRFAGYWKKRLTQPGNFSWPWTTSVERFLVWYPVGGDEPMDHSQELPRTDVIDSDDLDKIAEFQSPSQASHGDFISGRKEVGQVHMFEKPVKLCRYFIQKLTFPGDPVIDLFGCSGNFCIAAEQEERPWTYVELGAANFHWGVGRIKDAMRPDPQPVDHGFDADDQAAMNLPF
jgi:hypothetical protein